MVRLPAEYQEVEYIQGTSNARIDTGIPGNNDSLVISGKVYLNKFSAYQGFFGNYIDEDHNTSRLILGSSANGAVIANINRRAASSSVTQVGFYAGNTVEFKVSKTKLVFNGTEYSYAGVNNATANNTNILLNVANPASIGSDSERYKRWYYLRIHDSDTMLRNFIPCYRKSDSKPGMYDTVTNQFFAGYGTEEFIVGNDVSYDTASLIERRRQILLNTPHIATISNAGLITFNTDVPASVKKCVVNFTPVQEGSGDPSPDNVRPITGWDGVTVYKYGANLFPLALPSTAFKGTFSTGSSTIGSATNGRVWTMYVGTNQNLYYQHGSISPTVLFAFSDKPLTMRTDAVIYNAVNCANRNNVVLNSTTHPYLVIAVSNGSMLNPETGALDTASAMLSFGNTRKSYEKRTDPSSLTIPFPQTIYGGYVDLANGVLVEEWSQIASYNSETLPGEWISDRDVYTVGASPTIGAQIVYKLATPIIYQLTPQVIKTLKGINNIWSNTNGNVEIKYWGH